jgi:hypothetical protein
MLALALDCEFFQASNKFWTWPEVAQAAVEKCKGLGVRLLVVDTVGQFAGLTGDSENNAGDALAAMAPLQRAAGEGLAVVAIRHERKSGGEVGDSGRGSSAFVGAADVVISLRRPGGNCRPSLRELQAVSRYDDTPAKVGVELTANGYQVLDTSELALQEAKAAIIASASTTESEAMDLEAFCSSAGITRSSAQRATDDLQKEGKLKKVGAGKKGSPFRYFRTEVLSAQTHTRNWAE